MTVIRRFRRVHCNSPLFYYIYKIKIDNILPDQSLYIISPLLLV
nr:MAG TPA: hypothetical protein [Caudoviricetes sp.]